LHATDHSDRETFSTHLIASTQSSHCVTIKPYTVQSVSRVSHLSFPSTIYFTHIIHFPIYVSQHKQTCDPHYFKYKSQLSHQTEIISNILYVKRK